MWHNEVGPRQCGTEDNKEYLKLLTKPGMCRNGVGPRNDGIESSQITIDDLDTWQ